MQRPASTPAESAFARPLTVRGLAALGWVVGGVLALSACASERSVLVEVRGAAGAERLCLVASDGERVLFSQAYGDDALGAPASGTLRFVAGDEVSETLLVTARALRADAIVGAATSATGFGEASTVALSLDLARCHPRRERAATLVARDVVRIEAVGAGATLAVGDLDGDGREEALVLGVGGTLVTVDVERARAVVSAASDTGGRISALGDLDGDCALDALLVAADGVRVLRSAGGSVFGGAAFEGTVGASDAALGAASSGPRLAVCGPLGVSLVALDGTAPALALSSAATSAVVAVDLTGDRRAEIVAANASGARVWIASDAGFIAAPEVLPASFIGATERLVVLDADDDGALDLAGAGPTGLFLGRNRRDGTLEDGGSASAPSAAVTELLAVDLDGDCRDELAVLTADGEVALYAADGGLALRSEHFSGVAHLAAGDLDGDGADELALLGLDGALRVVSP